MSKHTLGPWKVERHGLGEDAYLNILDADGRIIADGVVLIADDEETNEGNANLIVAAPELLEALEGVIGWAEEAREKLRDSACPDAPTSDIERAYAAIAKAKGEDK